MQLLRHPGGEMKMTRNWTNQFLTQVKLNCPVAVRINSCAYRPDVGGRRLVLSGLQNVHA